MIKEMYNFYKAKRDHFYYYHCNVVFTSVSRAVTRPMWHTRTYLTIVTIIADIFNIIHT